MYFFLQAPFKNISLILLTCGFVDFFCRRTLEQILLGSHLKDLTQWRQFAAPPLP